MTEWTKSTIRYCVCGHSSYRHEGALFTNQVRKWYRRIMPPLLDMKDYECKEKSCPCVMFKFDHYEVKYNKPEGKQ